MSGFVQPQWSGFSQRPATASGTGDESPQPTGLEIERLTLGRGSAAAALSSIDHHALVQPARSAPAKPAVTPPSPRPHMALILGSPTP